MTPITCLCRQCRQIIVGRVLPPDTSLPYQAVAEDRRESFRRWVGFVAAVGEHMARRHPEVFEAANAVSQKALGIMALLMLRAVECSDPDLPYWRGVVLEEIREACRAAGLAVQEPSETVSGMEGTHKSGQ